ncbi:unnamed protein product [Darwinula stevensoni]|uniref:Chitin-binding type-2 domain-containing protein n=1 Tax=Darwinula stevensoni TaxID=69355 RepID=A0A7R8X6K9_9CRUS|nr:unnamed protein product [Darwinula stevensoni]CAG0888279.1 unnamed protein product [Darwinula stevensoni]
MEKRKVYEYSVREDTSLFEHICEKPCEQDRNQSDDGVTSRLDRLRMKWLGSLARGDTGYRVPKGEWGFPGIPGTPGVDYPTLESIPDIAFTCPQSGFAYYADPSTRCQVFHVCNFYAMYSFLCPIGTVFNQRYLVCDWWYNVDCHRSSSHYRRIDPIEEEGYPTREEGYPIEEEENPIQDEGVPDINEKPLLVEIEDTYAVPNGTGEVIEEDEFPDEFSIDYTYSAPETREVAVGRNHVLEFGPRDPNPKL